MKYAVIDLETTGHGIEDEIIQIAAVIVDEQLKVVETYNSFVKPSVEIPAFITSLTGIDEAIVADAPMLDDVILNVIPLLDDAVLVAHNAAFDAGFLNRALDQCGYLPFVGRRLDTIEMLRVLYPSISSYQLGVVAQLFEVSHEQQHRADSDAMATALIFIEMMKKLRQMPLLTLQRLSVLIDAGSDFGWLIQQTEQLVSSETALDSAEYDYYRQFALRAREWTEEKPPREEAAADLDISQLSFEQYLDMIQHNFKQKFPQYEERTAQVEMFHHVYNALSNDEHLLIEAGTGTGKSLGYLIPSLYYSIRKEAKVVVSTHTINLQEQLRHRDIPLLTEVLPFPFKASIFKGRGNYLCLRKFEAKVNGMEPISTNDDMLTRAQMVVWLNETETGDYEELNLSNRGAEYWSAVSSDADSCLNRACPWFKRCFYHRAKHESSIADVCITNHSMLFTDIHADHRLLPSYRHLIVDEAHHVEDVAGKHLGIQIAYLQLPQIITRLYKDSRTGMLLSLRSSLNEEVDDYKEAWIETIDAVIPQLQEIKDQWDALYELMFQLTSNGSEDNADTGGVVYRISSQELPKQWEAIAAAESNVHIELNSIITTVDKMLNDIKERAEESQSQALAVDINGAMRDLTRIKDELRIFVKLEKNDSVYWIEANPVYRFRSVQLYAAPVDVSEQLQKHFFDVKDSIVLTSATLTVQKSFQYAAEQLGLSGYEEQGRLKTVLLPSPFNYREQALVVIPRDFPVLKGASVSDKYIEKLAQSLAAAAVETKGRMLILFTSYRMLKMTYEPLKELLAGTDITVLGQGMDSSNRTKLTRRFLQHPMTVLLGTSSFWEGVDIPGDALVCLAIVRLPFQPPNHPLAEAKAELLLRKKQNPFMKLSIPQAVIRFKQGFGRLVRSAQDKGIVIIYDTRVIETYYGKHFLYSLPGPKIETMHADQMIVRMREWLNPAQVEVE